MKHFIDNKKVNAMRYTSFYDKYGNNILEAILEHQKELYENNEEVPHILIYIDDFYDPLLDEKYGIFNELYTAGRHYNVSIIQVSHRWKTFIKPPNKEFV